MSKNARSQLKARYKDPLPLVNVIPLPPLILHNPLSYLSCLYHYFCDRPPKTPRFTGRLDKATRSVWLIEREAAWRVWYAGFFGKGTFSRSEPSWYTRMRRQLGILGPNEQLVAEEVTARRRVFRMAMKEERARLEKEAHAKLVREEEQLIEPIVSESLLEPDEGPATALDEILADPGKEEAARPVVEAIPDLEHVQLTLYEALFLSLALDVLQLEDSTDNQPISKNKLFSAIIEADSDISSPCTSLPSTVAASTPFLAQYAVYHHYRAHGWVVKPGIKFGVDWILYDRGPVFSHAAYSIVVLREPCNMSAEADEQRAEAEAARRPWWWLQALNRVNAQVKKTVILCYVSFDDSKPVQLERGLKDVLQRYTIREVSIKRWNASRNR